MTPRVSSQRVSSLCNQQSWQKNSSKGKGKTGQDKGKGKGDQGKGRRVANIEPGHETQEQQPSASTGDQPEPEVTALYTLEDAMSPKSETRQEPRQSESHRGRSPRRAALQAPSKGTVPRGALMMAQSALASASGSNAELFGKMVSRAEKAVEEAKEKGIEANQALKDRDALAQLRAEAEQNREEVKEAMAEVRAQSRATSAPAAPSRRLRADLEARVHARAAKKADKDRQRAASHRAATGRDRTASWKRFEHAVHEPPKPRKLEPKRHRGGHHRSERRRQDEARKEENLAKMSEMSGEATPPWIQDLYEKSETESVAASGEDDLVNRLDRLQQDPAVTHKLDKVLQEAYEEAYGEALDLDSPELVESDFDVPMVDGPAPGMEDVIHHWEIAQKTLMPFKELHEKSKTVS